MANPRNRVAGRGLVTAVCVIDLVVTKYQRITDQVVKAEQKLDAFVSRGALSPQGKAAFIAATDPFHDLGIPNLAGWPDLETAPSVVRCIKRSLNIRAPDNAGSILIHSLPVLDSSVNHRAVRRNCVIDSVTTGIGNDIYVTPLLVNSYLATNANNMQCDNFQISQILDIADEYLTNPSRIIGMGFEVRDVTAPLYQQGTLTAFQVAQSQDILSTYNFRTMTVAGVTYASTVQTGRPLVGPPTNPANALLYPGTVQWEAKEGAYSVIPFSAKDNIARAPEYTMPVYRPGGELDECNVLNTTTIWTGPYASGSVNGDNFVFEPHSYAPMHSKGVMLTGLSSQSTFQINLIVYLETFPNRADDPLLTLAAPSACYDPIALEMISAASKELPVAVPVNQNNAGDFFAEVVAKVAPIIGTIASAMFPTFSPLIAGLATGASGIANKYLSDKAMEKEKKKVRRERSNNKTELPPRGKLPPGPVNPNTRLSKAQKTRATNLRIKEEREIMNRGAK